MSTQPPDDDQPKGHYVTDAELDAMTPDEINDARRAGRLDMLLGRGPFTIPTNRRN